SDMPGISTLNASLLAAALVTGAMLTAVVSASDRASHPEESLAVQDATGASIPVRPYGRIASTSTIADQVLVRLVEPSRLLAVSRHTQRTQQSDVYDGKVGVERARDIEAIIELRPDIVFINNFVDRRHVQRLEEAGLNVFDLGPMAGLDTLLPNIRQIAAVLGVPRRGEELVARLERELQAVAGDIDESKRVRALYVGIHGDRLYGGTAGTSFHDVLVAAGLIDVAAEAGFEGWPAYTNEQLLSLDPPFIITNPVTEQTLCRHPGLDALTACKAGQIRSIDTDLLTDPGLRMVQAAAAVHAVVYEHDN
ncbi:MAG: ABC transporter substrate-binding protein, partial [Myxococcales bacterium]